MSWSIKMQPIRAINYLDFFPPQYLEELKTEDNKINWYEESQLQINFQFVHTLNLKKN